MKIEVDDEKKIVSIWQTKAERDDPQIAEQLKDVFAEWKKKKYLVAVFKSGDEDLFENTLALLKYNRNRMAELEVRKAREAEQSGMSVKEKLQAFRELSNNTASSRTVRSTRPEL